VRSWAAALVAASWICASSAGAAGFDWTPFEQDSVIHILTHDEDGALRNTSVWVVVVDGAGYVRTNASRWLENIQRNPEVQIQARGYDYLMRAEEVQDSVSKERVEEAFREKYGVIQRLMSFFRLREPSVLRLVPRTAAAPASR
jgi:hypothetical protein